MTGRGDRDVALDLMRQVGMQPEDWSRDGDAELVVYFPRQVDAWALQELTYFGPYEFGCAWEAVRPGLLRGPLMDLIDWLTGRTLFSWGRVIPAEDLPTLIDLLRRELTGKLLNGAAHRILHVPRTHLDAVRGDAQGGETA